MPKLFFQKTQKIYHNKKIRLKTRIRCILVTKAHLEGLFGNFFGISENGHL